MFGVLWWKGAFRILVGMMMTMAGRSSSSISVSASVAAKCFGPNEPTVQAEGDMGGVWVGGAMRRARIKWPMTWLAR